jgi:hypothetical protein
VFDDQVSFEYEGGENFLRRYLRMYSGMQLTDVITSTFQMKPHDERKSGSEKNHNQNKER